MTYLDDLATGGGAARTDWTRSFSFVSLVFGVCFFLAVVFRYESLFATVIDPDESLYLVMAQQWLAGGLPYVTVWDHHSVGLPALFALIQMALPDSIVAIRLSAALAVAVTATTVYFLLRPYDRSHLSPILAASVYLVWTSRYAGLPANCELYLNALVAPAMLLVFQRPASGHSTGSRNAVIRYCAGALLIGIALQVKHVLVAETALYLGIVYCLATKAGRAKWSILAAVAVALALPSLIVMAYFHFNGLLFTYLDAIVLSNLSYAGQGRDEDEVLTRIPLDLTAFFIAVCFYGVVKLLRGGNRRQGVGFALLWAAAASVDIVLPGQYWPHYFILMLPAASILAGHLLVSAMQTLWWRRLPRLAGGLFVLSMVFACNPNALYRERLVAKAMAADDAPRQVAAGIAAAMPPGNYLFVFNYQPIVYWLTKSRLPTKHILPVDWSDEFRHVTRFDQLSELADIFALKPLIVVTADRDLVGMDDAVIDQVAKHLQDYDLMFEMRDRHSMVAPVTVKVHRRKPSAERATTSR